MRVELSAAVTRALAKAHQVAKSHGCAQIRARDLLQGLVDEEEGRPILLLESAGVDLAKLRLQFPNITGELADHDDVALDSITGEILDQARELARVHGSEGTVASEHVLVSLLDADASLREKLEAVGLDFGNLREQIAPQGAPLVLEGPLEIPLPTETIDNARILDASANRAREALRVLEDYCRFVLADAFLSAQLKKLRHDLAEALVELPADLLLLARDTLHDVGTTVTTTREQERSSFVEVAQANAKRLQEALRSLEEFGKMVSPAFGMAIEQLRYTSYTLERALLLGGAARERLRDARLYVLVTESLCRASLVGTVREALMGGAQIIQLREKKDGDRILLEKARDLRRLTRSAGALFIVNDRPDIALLAEADGVHLGQDDLPLREARRLLGPEALIGISTHNLDQVRQAVLQGASYLGVGPTFPSKTKGFANFPGLDFVRQATAETSVPVFVLGGVNADNLEQVISAGGTRVAVSHGLCAAEDPRDGGEDAGDFEMSHS